MLDPISALTMAASAVSSMRTLINAGKDTTSAMSKFAGAYADIHEADRRARNPKWWQKFNGSLEERAANAFAAKKKAEKLNKELLDMIRFVHGPTGLEEYKDILRDMKKTKEQNEWKAQKMKEAIVEWIVTILALGVGFAVLAAVLFVLGKSQGKW